MTMLDFPRRPWLASYPATSDWSAPLPPEPVTAAIDRAVAEFPDRPAVDFLGKTCTYARLGELVARAARGLRGLGVEKGTRVGILLPNTPYYVVLYHAVLRLGGIVVNLNPLYAEEEIRRTLRDSGTTVVATLDLTLTLPKLVKSIAGTKVEKVVVCSMAAALPTSTGLLFRLLKRSEIAAVPSGEMFVTFAALIDNHGDPTPVAIDPVRDVAVLQYTGGTTGVPKGAMLTHANLTVNRDQVLRWYPSLRRGEERILGVLPLFHVFAMTVVMNFAIGCAAEMILLPRFQLAQVLKTIGRKRPTLFPVVPTLLNALNHDPQTRKHDLSSLRCCISGGAPLPAEVKQTFEDLTGCVVVEGYGLSEASPVVTCNPPEGKNKAGSIGLPLPGTTVEIRALDGSGRALPPGELGEICARGPQVMAGYWERPEETASVLDNGLLRTGDVGYMDEEGYIFLVDRLKDVVVVNGYKVYPRMGEEAIYRHPAVAEVTVIGVPDPDHGQIAKAFVRLKEGAALTDAELHAFLADKLSPIEQPREIEFRAELPKTMIGKLSKKELLAEELAKRLPERSAA